MALLDVINQKITDATEQLATLPESLGEVSKYVAALQSLQTVVSELSTVSTGDVVEFALAAAENLTEIQEYIEANKQDTAEIQTRITALEESGAGDGSDATDLAEEFVTASEYNLDLQNQAAVLGNIEQTLAELRTGLARSLVQIEDIPTHYGPVTPRQFGAVGNGENDDTAALQAAVDHCAQTGRKLYLDGLVYLVSAPIIAKVDDAHKSNGLKIEGENATIIISENFTRGDGKAVFETLQFKNGETPAEILTMRRIDYRQLQILNPYKIVVAGIACSGMTGCSLIEDVRVDHCYHGIMFSGGWVATVRRAYVTYATKIGIFFGTYKHIEWDFDASAITYGDKDQDLEIVNEGWVSSSTASAYTASNAMIIEGCRTQRCYVGIAFHGGTNVSIRDNNSELNEHAEFQCTYSVAACQIENNYFENTSGSNSLVVLGAKDCALKNGSFRHNWMLNNKLLIIGMDTCDITRNTLNGTYADNPWIGPWVRKNVSQWPAKYDSTPITPTPTFIRDGEVDESLPLRHGGTFSSGLKDCQLVGQITAPAGTSQTIGIADSLTGYLISGLTGTGTLTLLDGVTRGCGTVSGTIDGAEFADHLTFAAGEVLVTGTIGSAERSYAITDGVLAITTAAEAVIEASITAV